MTPLRLSSIVCFLGFLFSSLFAFAQNEAAFSDSKEHRLRVSQEKQWLDLIHFHRTGFDLERRAQADGADFYLSRSDTSEKSISAEAELEATLRAMTGKDPSAEIICRYPARYFWLKNEFSEFEFGDFDCPEFNRWESKIDAKGLTLVFPAAYLNSPSSMYGHTFLRIDRHSGENDLLDYSVNFAANTDPNDNELVFTYKGLNGGYPGVYSVLPYYEKVKEYSYLESRDVWEYRLSLTPEEVNQFVRHIWEVKDTYFDYYFFDENCSYQLLTIIDAASERLSFTKMFRFSAIPADTVRAIADSGLVEEAVFRPSTLSQMQHMINYLPDEHLSKAKEIVDEEVSIDDALEQFSSVEKARILELAYQYSRYLAVRKKVDRPNLGKRSIALLSHRSKQPETQVFPAYPVPQVRDDQGHDSRRLYVGHGYTYQDHYQELGLRAAYHDHLDTLPGYIAGAQLEMGNLILRRIEQGDETKFRLQRFAIFDIATYTPRNQFITPISWHVSTGWYRPDPLPNAIMPYLVAGGGVAYSVAEQRIYFQTDLDLSLDNDLDKGFRIAAGPRLGWLSQHDRWSLKLESYLPIDLAGERFSLRKLTLGLATKLTDNVQLRGELEASNYIQSSNHAMQNQRKSVQNRAFSIGFAYYY